MQSGKCRRNEAQAANDPQAILRREHVQQGDNLQRTGPGAEQVRAVDGCNLFAVVHER